MNDVKFNKLLIFINSLVPLLLLAWDAMFGNLGVNPIEFFLRTTGVMTLVFLLITLSVTPLRKYFGWNSLIKFRRMLGLYSFFSGRQISQFIGADSRRCDELFNISLAAAFFPAECRVFLHKTAL